MGEKKYIVITPIRVTKGRYKGKPLFYPVLTYTHAKQFVDRFHGDQVDEFDDWLDSGEDSPGKSCQLGQDLIVRAPDSTMAVGGEEWLKSVSK